MGDVANQVSGDRSRVLSALLALGLVELVACGSVTPAGLEADGAGGAGGGDDARDAGAELALGDAAGEQLEARADAGALEAAAEVGPEAPPMDASGERPPAPLLPCAYDIKDQGNCSGSPKMAGLICQACVLDPVSGHRVPELGEPACLWRTGVCVATCNDCSKN